MVHRQCHAHLLGFLTIPCRFTQKLHRPRMPLMARNEGGIIPRPPPALCAGQQADVGGTQFGCNPGRIVYFLRALRSLREMSSESFFSACSALSARDEF